MRQRPEDLIDRPQDGLSDETAAETTALGRQLYTGNLGRDFTHREWQTLVLSAQGLYSKEIGWHLGGLSSRTIEVYKANFTEKLGARNAVHAVAIAISKGLISLDEVIPAAKHLAKRRYPGRYAHASTEDAAEWLKNGGRLS